MPWTEKDRTEVKQRKAVENAKLDERHAGFDLAAKDHTPKYHRPHFAVVGEGTKTAREKYHEGYAKIDWNT